MSRPRCVDSAHLKPPTASQTITRSHSVLLWRCLNACLHAYYAAFYAMEMFAFAELHAGADNPAFPLYDYPTEWHTSLQGIMQLLLEKICFSLLV